MSAHTRLITPDREMMIQSDTVWGVASQSLTERELSFVASGNQTAGQEFER